MKRTQNTFLLIAGIGLLLSLFVGAIAGAVTGGLVGYFAGRGQVQAAPEELEARLDRLEGGLRESHAQLEQMRVAVQELHHRMEEGMPYGPPWGELPPGEMPWGEMPPHHPGEGAGGARVTEVLPDTPAAEAGLQPGDLILAINDEPVTPEQPLPEILERYRPKDRVILTILRGEELFAAELRLGRHPEDHKRAYLGVRAMQIAP